MDDQTHKMWEETKRVMEGNQVILQAILDRLPEPVIKRKRALNYEGNPTLHTLVHILTPILRLEPDAPGLDIDAILRILAQKKISLISVNPRRLLQRYLDIITADRMQPIKRGTRGLYVLRAAI